MHALLAVVPVALGGPAEVMPDRHWDVTALDLDVRIDPIAQTVEGTATHTVTPLGRRVGHLRLDQVALDIREVRVDGAIVEGWRVGPDRLEIPMPSTGDAHVVAVSYAGTPQLGLHFRGPPQDAYVEVWSQGQDEESRYWFPTWDYPNDTFAYTAAITAPADLVVLSNGEQVGRTEQDGQATWRYRLDGPIPAYLVAVAIGPYRVQRVDGPVPLEYVAHAGVPADDVVAALGQTPELMAWLGDRLDEPYPWPVFRQVFVQRFLYGAMENTSLVVHADFLIEPAGEPWGVFTEEVVAHELAHQWFGDRVTPYGWRDLWLSEAFASFYAAEWQRHLRGEEQFAAQIADWQDKAYGNPLPVAPTVMTDNDLVGAAILIYARGGLALHGLRTWLGPDVFDRAVAAYLDEHAGRLVETADFRRALEDASGTHLGWWFDTYVHGARFPAAKTRWSWAEGLLTVEIEQTTEGGALESPVVVEVGTNTTTRELPTWLGPGVTRLVLDLPEPPAWVSVDPEGAVLATWEHTQDPGAWVAQLRHSEHPYARLVAMRHLDEGQGGDDALRALAEVTGDDDLPADYRVRAVRTLGAIGSPAAVAELMSALDEGSPVVRKAIVGALGGTLRKDATAERLADVFASDPDGRVRGEALRALAEHDADEAVALARKRIGQPFGARGFFEHVDAAAVLASHGDDSDIPRLLALTEPGTPYYVQATTSYALPGALDRLDDGPKADAARARVSRRIASFLGDADVRLRETAIGVLQAAGDDDSAEELTAFAATCEVPWLAERARDAAAAIRQRGRGEAEPEGAPTDLERVEERLKALEDRLKRLEEWRY